MSGDAVTSSGTVVALPLRYSDRRLAMLSVVRHEGVRMALGPTGRVGWGQRWYVADAAEAGGFRRLGAHDARALEALRALGAIMPRMDATDEYLLSGLGEVIGPLWTNHAESTGRAAAVLGMVNAVVRRARAGERVHGGDS